jgi:hypothetical protein
MRRTEITEKRINYIEMDYEHGFIKFCGFKAVHAQWGRFETRVATTRWLWRNPLSL